MLAKRVKSLSWPFPQFISSEQTQTKEVETWGDNVIKIPALFHPKTMFMLYQIAIAQARKPYRIGLLFTGHMRTVISSESTPRRSWNRLRAVPHFSSGIVERAKRERAWKSPFLQWGDFHARLRFARSTIPEEKWETTRSLILKVDHNISDSFLCHSLAQYSLYFSCRH